jgi:hypothetical protein
MFENIDRLIRSHPMVIVLLLLVSGGREAFAGDVDLTLKFVDGISGLPTDARVRIYRPGGWAFDTMDPVLLTHTSSQTGEYVHASDSLVVTGPEGSWGFWVSRGITSVPVQASLILGESTTRELSIHDWIDPRVDGWYGADPHVHLFHDEGLFYDAIPHDRAAQAARGEGLDLMYLLENEADHAGGAVIPGQPGVTLVWGEEYRNSFWGHTVWLGLDELVWYPIFGPGCCGELFPAWPTLANTFEEFDEGLRILAHPRSTDEPLDPFAQWPGSGYARERGALALGDQLHGFAVASASNFQDPWAIEDYLAALKSGARWAAVGEGDRALDRYNVSPPGSPRTYAWIGDGWARGDPAMAAAWEAAVRDRRCYATTGPVVRSLEVEGVPMGGAYAVGTPGLIDLSFSVAAYRPLTRLRLHGATGAHWEFIPGPGKTSLDTTVSIQVDHDDFVVLEVEARSDGWSGLAFPPRAVWVITGDPWPVDPLHLREESDELEAFFEQASSLRGFDSAGDSVEAWNDIGGAAAVYESMFDDPPPAFDLIHPEDGAQILASAVELSWSASVSHDGEAMSYHLLVARDPGFVDVVVDLVTLSVSYALTDVTEPVSLYWKVEALEPGDPPTLASNAPRSFFLTGGVVAAPPGPGPPLEIVANGSAANGIRLSVSLRDASDLNVRWVDVRGRVVGEENLGRLPGGVRQLTLDARDRNGEILARGVYWLVARAGPHRDVVRVTWLR